MTQLSRCDVHACQWIEILPFVWLKKEVVLEKPFPGQIISVLNMMKLCALYCTIAHGVLADESLNLLQTMVHKHHANETLGPIRNFYGAVVSLCHPGHRKCIRMNGEHVDTIPWTDNAGLPEEAKFTVVDGGLFNVAFWNARHQRYIRLKVDVRIWPPAEIRSVVSTSRGMCDLPLDWLQERFKIHDGGPGLTEKPCSQQLCAYECTRFCGCCRQCRRC